MVIAYPIHIIQENGLTLLNNGQLNEKKCCLPAIDTTFPEMADLKHRFFNFRIDPLYNDLRCQHWSLAKAQSQPWVNS